jgi:glycosyltransferase involved in cell wall biosynthesis
MNNKIKTISVIMPSLNEEANISNAINNTLDAFDKLGLEGEVIVINDGSNDRTGELVIKLSENDKRIKLIQHSFQKGIGKSFWSGVSESQMEFITMFPGDNENNQLDSLIFLNMTDNVDIIVPYIVNNKIRSISRIIISKIFRVIVNYTFGLNLNYTNGAVIYRSNVIKKIKPISFGFFYQAEILIRLILSGYLYAETPHYLKVRQNGATKALTVRSLFEIIRSYIILLYQFIFKKNEFIIEIDENSETHRREQENVQFSQG